MIGLGVATARQQGSAGQKGGKAHEAYRCTI
jgi:hypothetical protein